MNKKHDNFILLSKKFYSLEALKRTIYDLSDKVNILLKDSNENYKIIFDSNKNYSKKFLSVLSDHEIRLDLEPKFLVIRNLFISKAIEAGLEIEKMEINDE